MTNQIQAKEADCQQRQARIDGMRQQQGEMDQNIQSTQERIASLELACASHPEIKEKLQKEKQKALTDLIRAAKSKREATQIFVQSEQLLEPLLRQREELETQKKKHSESIKRLQQREDRLQALKSKAINTFLRATE